MSGVEKTVKITEVGMGPLTGGHMGPPLQNDICHLHFALKNFSFDFEF
jgi:hypothetical protein